MSRGFFSTKRNGFAGWRTPRGGIESVHLKANPKEDGVGLGAAHGSRNEAEPKRERNLLTFYLPAVE